MGFPAPVVPAEPGANQHRWRADLLAGAALALVTALVALATWGRWGNLSIDCGREMLVPAALLSGKRLYFDFWYPYGPLIPHWNTWLSSVFGVRLEVLYASGLLAATLLIAATYAVARQFVPPSLAFAATLPVVLQGFYPNLFNYVLPYAYPAIYGAACSMTVLWLCLRAVPETRRGTLLAASIGTGIALSSKIEFGIACLCMMAGAILLRFWRQRSGGSLAGDILAVAPGPLLAAVWYALLLRESSFHFLFEENIPLGPGAHFVKAYGSIWLSQVGFPATFREGAQCAAVLIPLLAAGWVLAHWSRSPRSSSPAAAAVIVICAGLLATLTRSHLAILAETARLFLTAIRLSPRQVWASLVLGAIALVKLRRNRLSEAGALQVLLAASTLALGLRVSALATPANYGIFYDAPVAALWLVTLLEIAQLFGATRSALAGTGRTLTAALCTGAVLATLPSYLILFTPSAVLPSDRGYIRAEAGKVAAYSDVLRFLHDSGVPSGKWVSLPEDTSLYYFAHAFPVSRWFNLIPGVLPPGKPTADYLQELERADTRFVVLSNRTASEYGETTFGEGNWDPEVIAWIRNHFVVVRQFGDWDHGWGARICERIPSRLN